MANLMRHAARYVWAITPEALDRLLETGAQTRSEPGSIDKQVAVIPIRGEIVPRGSIFDELFGRTSIEQLSETFDRAVKSDRVDTILLDIDSPGGVITGVPEFAEQVRRARDEKNIVALANAEAASAAFWIGSAANTFVATPSASVGSIGVFRLHLDHSKMLEEIGVRPTFIAQPARKVEGNPFEPLDDEALEFHQGEVDAAFDDFVSAVARNRGVTTAVVKRDFGGGRVVKAKNAVQAGMIDAVEPQTQLLSRLLGNQRTSSRRKRAANLRLRERAANF